MTRTLTRVKACNVYTLIHINPLKSHSATAHQPPYTCLSFFFTLISTNQYGTRNVIIRLIQ